MRTPAVVLAIAMLALPSTPLAQQREATPAAATDDRATPASDPASRQAAAPRSLMGTVMTILIESAERSGRQAAERAKAGPADSRPSVDPEASDEAAAERVAVQAVP
jgi:hypothetical protein